MTDRALMEQETLNRLLKLSLAISGVRGKLLAIDQKLVGMRNDPNTTPEQVEREDDVMTRCLAEMDSAADTMLIHLKGAGR